MLIIRHKTVYSNGEYTVFNVMGKNRGKLMSNATDQNTASIPD